MKRIIYILFLCSALNATAQNLIPNANFEQWINIGGWYDNPADWQTSNNQIMAVQITKDSNAYSGNFAMKMQTATTSLLPYARCGFPLNDHPVYLQGYVAQSMANGDSASITALIYFQGNVIDSARYVIYSGINPNYTFFMVPVSTNMNVADSCEVIINGCSFFNDAIYVDDLALVFLTGIDEAESIAIQIYPNPAAGYLNIHLSEKKNSTVQLFNQSLKLVKAMQQNSDNIIMDLSNVARGIYYVRVELPGKSFVRKIEVLGY